MKKRKKLGENVLVKKTNRKGEGVNIGMIKKRRYGSMVILSSEG